MKVFHSVVDTLDNRIAEVGFFHYGFYIVVAIVLCNVVIGAYRFIRFVIFGLDGAG